MKIPHRVTFLKCLLYRVLFISKRLIFIKLYCKHLFQNHTHTTLEHPLIPQLQILQDCEVYLHRNHVEEPHNKQVVALVQPIQVV